MALLDEVEAAFKGTASAVTKGARIVGAATAGVFLLVDVDFLEKESMHLHNGAKAISAENLRQRVRELERKLEELTQIYKHLQEDPTPPPPEQHRVQSHSVSPPFPPEPLELDPIELTAGLMQLHGDACQQLVELISKLQELADNVDKVHRDCTISNVVTHSTGTLSGALTILGLALAPMTAGASMALSVTGIGLGAATAVTAVSTSTMEHVEAAFKGTASAVTKGARIVGAATAGVFLLVDVGFLVKESMHLHNGAKTASAENLRQQARELERKLEELTQIYKHLQEDPTPPPPEHPCSRVI
ncbi:APOL3 [Cervus elaphus hippelaphus]|uniref:APOL3 n=1 Tax=Cervus elaphus hippelaphus TaxID=46360 RepID=A0A212CDA3_CEREH|nr:APOL3 [Cervus elaphus hippelaphus]